MAGEWLPAKLGDYIEVKHGFAFDGEYFSDEDNRKVLLTPGNFEIGGGFKDNKLKYYNGLIPEDYILKGGDIIVTMTDLSKQSDTLGYPARVPQKNDYIFLHNQRLGKIIVKSEEIDRSYLYYLLRSNEYREEILAGASGTSIKHTAPKRIESFKFLMPPKSEQIDIAAVLDCLENKIDLNQRVNNTLESIARALFKSWFVNFDPVKAKAEGRKPEGMDDTVAALFPSNFSASSLGLIPEGWDMAEMGEVADVIDCLHSKKPERTNEGKPFLQLNNIRDDGLMDMTDMYLISDEDYKKWVSRIEAQEGDCVITNVGRVGAVAQIPKGLKAALGRNMTAIRTKSSFKNPTFLICYLCSDFAKNEIRLKEDTGTILNALNVRNIPKLRFLKANKAVHDEFEKLVRPIRSRMEQNLAEITTLANIRDLLLPRLISGKLRVEEVSETVEALAL